MNAAGTHKEADALARLRLMDTPPEPEFDELVSLAAAICGVPISLITLVDISGSGSRPSPAWRPARPSARWRSARNASVEMTVVRLV